jgi:hypothetical protein
LGEALVASVGSISVGNIFVLIFERTEKPGIEQSQATITGRVANH